MTAKRTTPPRSPAVSGALRRISDAEVWRLAGQLTQIVWRASADGQSIVAPAWETVTGQAHEELVASGWVERVHPEDRARVDADWTDAMRGGAEFVSEFRLRLADGKYEWFRARGEPLRNRRGQVKSWVGITSNIDEQRRANDALRESADRLRLIVDSARIGTLEWSLDEDQIYVNARACELFGVPVDAALSVETLQRAIDPDDMARLRQVIDAALDPWGSGEFDITFRVRSTRRGEASEAWVAARGVVRLVELGEHRRGAQLLGVLTDATRETHDVEARAWLGERAHETQLRAAQQVDALGHVAGGVAHDLNNILTAMMASVHLVIQHGAVDARSRARLAQVRDECIRASSVLRELLAFGRKQPTPPQVLSANDVLRESEPMLARLVGEDVRIKMELGAASGVFMDRAELLQLLVSLAVQARTSMPTGGSLVLATRDEPGTDRAPRRVVLTVTDNGAGLAPETRERLLEPYVATPTAGWGMALGVSVARSIVSRAGGMITAESDAGSGTTFTIALPAVELPVSIHLTPSDAGPAAGGSETILLIEDERVLRDQLADALRQLGYTVLEARNGYDAFSALERHAAPVHLVLSDLVMPEMSGGAFVAQLRSWYPRVRALFMTGYSEDVIAPYGALVEDTETLLKPFSVPELASKLRAVLDAERTSPNASDSTPRHPHLYVMP